jgi:UDP-N-acetylmuramoylalanine--D-glutamate ligase
MIRVDCFQDQEVAVFGLGSSGLAAAKALIAGGANVFAWDDDDAHRQAAIAQGLPLKDALTADWRDVSALVLSPGVPLTHPRPHPIVDKARSAGAEIIGDVELLFRSTREVRKTAISGTNGKSTTTALIGHVMQRAGRRVEVGGNLGPPVLAFEHLPAGADYILELSSYQIDLTPSLIVSVAVLLNISPDHLDRHGDMDGYVAVKKRLFQAQQHDAIAIVGIDDAYGAEIFSELKARGRPRVIAISVGFRQPGGVSVVGGVLFDDIAGSSSGREIDLTKASSLPGVHNWQNAAACYAACRALEIAPDEIADGLMTFPGLAHRQERIAEIDGVAFINDSKATNAVSAARALACYETIYWIVGGRPKSDGLDGIEPYDRRIKHAFLIGEATPRFGETLQGRVAWSDCADLDQAVAAASAMARRDGLPGAVVLLSPACASFDQFVNFEARGDAFRLAVLALQEARS